MTAPDETLASRFNPNVAKALVAATKNSPFAALLGIEIVDVQPGKVVIRLPVTEKLASGVGAVHGGAIVSLIDHSLSLVVYPLVEVGKGVATLEFKVSYVSPVREGEMAATAEVLSLRKRLGTVRIDVTCAGKLAATAVGTVYIKDKLGA